MASLLGFALTVSAQTRPATPVTQPARTAQAATAQGAARADAGAGTSVTAAAGATAGATMTADAGVSPLADAGAVAPAAPMSAGPIPTFRPHAPPLPPPTPEQTAAFDAMSQAAETYQRGAADYKDAITTIVTLHYEEKKKAILGGLDREIGIEKDELKKARETAIKRLEDFVARVQRSERAARGDARTRCTGSLRSTRSARARTTTRTAISPSTLRPAIALYKRVIREFPTYNELAGIYYFLGHALNDSRRSDEAQQVWRSLVCHNHYPYPVPPDPKVADADQIQPMPQDHDNAFWTAWRYKYPTAAALKKGPKADTVYDDPYPNDCAIVPQPTLLPGAGSEVRRGDLVAHRRLGVRPARPARRRGRHRAVGRVGLQPCGERLHALDAVQEAAALSAWRSTSTRGRSSSSSATTRPSASSSTCSTTPTSKRS